ncbi:MAG: hypothetical protein ABI861_12990, partial [Panacibacter sp.]
MSRKLLLQRSVLPVLSLICVLIFSSWGFLAHKTAHQLAIYELPEDMNNYFYKHIDYLLYNSVGPDVRKKKDKTEAPKHYIDLEA